MIGTGRQDKAPILLLAALALLAGCVPRAAAGPEPARPSQQPQRSYSNVGLESVMGRDARAVVALFGNPALDVREGAGRKLQFAGPACVLDAYFYAPRGGGEPVVTHIDARLPDGRDIDRSSCVAALSLSRRAR